MPQVIEIPTDQLFVGKANVRKNLGDISELTVSIQEHGVLHPVTVRPADGRYEVVVGRRRTAAAKAAGLKTIPAIIKKLNDDDAMIESLIENLQRGDLEVEDEGLAYERLLEVYGSLRNVAQVVGKSYVHVNHVLDALSALRKLQAFGIGVGVNQVNTQKREREQGRRLPARHASELEVAFRAPTVDEYLSDEEERGQKYIEMAQAIAPLPRHEAKKVLDRFKLYPDRAIDEIKAEALAPVDLRTRLAPGLARRLDEAAQQQGLHIEELLPRAVESFVCAQEAEVRRREQREAARRVAKVGADIVPVVRRVPARKANDLDGAAWTRYSISVWNDIRKNAEELGLGHPAMFPAMLAERLIQCFTTANEKVVLDPMAGSGSAIVAAKRLGKIGIGIELSEEYATTAWKRLEKIDGPGQGVVHVGDANRLLDFVDLGTVDFGVTSPPYWDILAQQRTADGKPVRDYVEAEGNIGAIADYAEFVSALKRLYGLVYQVLKPGAYFCTVVMDVRKKDRLYPLHSDLAQAMEELGFIYDDLIIWDRRQEYSNLRPLGYPSVFRINRIHEYVLIFKKPEAEDK